MKKIFWVRKFPLAGLLALCFAASAAGLPRSISAAAKGREGYVPVVMVPPPPTSQCRTRRVGRETFVIFNVGEAYTIGVSWPAKDENADGNDAPTKIEWIADLYDATGKIQKFVVGTEPTINAGTNTASGTFTFGTALSAGQYVELGAKLTYNYTTNDGKNRHDTWSTAEDGRLLLTTPNTNQMVKGAVASSSMTLVGKLHRRSIRTIKTRKGLKRRQRRHAV